MLNSEQMYAAIVEMATDGILAIDEHSTICFANPAAEKIFGYTIQEIIGQDLTMLMPEHFRAAHKNSFSRYLQTGLKHIPWKGVELRAKTKSGEEIPVEISFGEFTKQSTRFFVGIIRDISERNKVEEAHHEAAERWRSLVKNAPNAIMTIDRNGTIEFLNRAVSGYSVEQIIGTSVYDYVPSYEIESKKKLYEEVFRTGEPQTYEVLGPGPNRTAANYHVSVGSVMQKGKVSSLILIATDITEHKRTQKLQAALYQIAEETNSAEDLPKFYAALHRIIDELMYAKNFFIALYNDKNNLLTFPYCVDQFDEAPLSLAAGKSLTAYVLRTGEPLLITSEEFDKKVQAGEVELIGAPFVDWLGVPLQSKNKVFGVLAVQSYSEQYRYGDHEKGVLTFVSQHIASALERKQAEKALRRSEEKYRKLFEESEDAIFITSVEGKFLDVNNAAVKLYGYSSKEELMSISIQNDLFVDPHERELYQEEIREKGYVKDYELTQRKKNGEILQLIETSTSLEDENGKIIGYRGIIRDVTRLRDLEERLRQAQKMEAVGQLAGGVAHDFNNTLMAISGYGELLLHKTAGDESLRNDLLEILKAAEGGARLTRQLLAFSRKQILEPRIIDLNLRVANNKDMLHRLIREDVHLEFIFGPNLHRVKVDPGQLEQVLLNLVINARDAMPKGGQLRIRTSDVKLDENFDAPAGSYVLMEVSDTGIGMSETTLSHIFEPFFTTKEKGKGTGLGLATVYGIIKQTGGYISASSEIGKGTVFRIYFPAIEDQEATESAPAFHHNYERKGETILLVDDNDPVRNSIAQLLEGHGYHVLTASNGKEALEVAEKSDRPIDLLITDVVMPQMSGHDLAHLLTSQLPALKTLFMSGYDEEGIAYKGNLDPGKAFVPKPASIQSILQKIRELVEPYR